MIHKFRRAWAYDWITSRCVTSDRKKKLINSNDRILKIWSMLLIVWKYRRRWTTQKFRVIFFASHIAYQISKKKKKTCKTLVRVWNGKYIILKKSTVAGKVNVAAFSCSFHAAGVLPGHPSLPKGKHTSDWVREALLKILMSILLVPKRTGTSGRDA